MKGCIAAFVLAYFPYVQAEVYRIEDGNMRIEKDRGQEGLRDVIPPGFVQKDLSGDEEQIAKRAKELKRSKMKLKSLSVKGRIARPRLPFYKTPPQYVETDVYEEPQGEEQGRWEIYRDSLQAARQLRIDR
ncbi:MAG: hypothetical protein AB8C84_06810 [Oligoflexales bacterium]